ncbi:uncharacterized protein RJT20DRAFT_97879 [Scheffersomyces xylosifermentans]|uniref:uncharacterized protein n=1 Tax=Scheffersomyces xylosifermentans TaxID=1304137 RepID=UPI00315D8096
MTDTLDSNTASSQDPTAATSSGKKQKNIPLELTAYGTTPSGKPRLFVCQVCTRAFARLEHLRRHERSHTKEKPFSCGVCQRKFSRRDLLLRHAQKLHAGCSDAITRLRRKSIKRSNSTGGGEDDDDDLGDEIDDMDDIEGIAAGRSKKNNDPVDYSSGVSSTNSTRKNSTTNTSIISTPLQRQVMLDHRKKQAAVAMSRSRRGASFSAQSGANYAIAIPEFPDLYPQSDNVEFSTPQMLPSSMNDEMGWLSNLSTIPGMSDGLSAHARNSISVDHPMNLNNSGTPPVNVSQHGSFSHASSSATPQLRSDSINSIGGGFDSVSYMMPTATITNQELQNGVAAAQNIAAAAAANLKDHSGEESNEFGYSFYDIPETMFSGKAFDSITSELEHHPQHSGHLFKSLTPIKQEEDELMEDNIYDTSNGGNINGENNRNSNFNGGNEGNFDLNFLNDIDELTHEFDVNSKFLPNGYSFYGDNPSASSSGIETNSPNMIVNLPSQAQAQPQQNNKNSSVFEMTLDHNQLLSIDNSINDSFTPQSAGQQLNSFQHPSAPPPQYLAKLKLKNYSKNKLFTNGMRHMINKSLGKYPISGIMTPTIPSNEKLEFYLTTFVHIFLSHFPFIHISKLNEYEVMNMTANEDANNESSRVCLPLLIATIGALLANNKNDSEHLYEASRRTIHIYLESRKNSVNDDTSRKDKDSNSTINPLWLIQSLTLSVIYGLFSDNENNVYIVIRQLNALNSLVKTSIKSNRVILFSINGEDEEIFNKLNSTLAGNTANTNGASGGSGESSSLFSSTYTDELRFKNNINIQSQIRIVFMIYRLTNFLLMMYNVPLTLSINDLHSLVIPNHSDEALWGFKTFQEFQEFSQKSHRLLDHFLNNDKIVFKDLLLAMTKHDAETTTAARLRQLSKYGYICVVHGLFEIKQFQEMKNFDIFQRLDDLTRYLPPPSPSTKSQQQSHSPDFERLDYALLVNFVKISSLVDFKLVKEQSWLRNFDELTKNFNKFLISNNPNSPDSTISDQDYLRIIDCCLMLLKLILLKTEDILPEESHNGGSAGSSVFNTDFGFLNHEFSSLLINNPTNEGVDKDNSLADFEKNVNLRIYEEFDNSSNSIHTQMLFHVFTVLSVFSIYIVRKNNSASSPAHNFGGSSSPDVLFELNHRFSMILKFLDKIENYLKSKYQVNHSNGGSAINVKLEQDFTNLYLYNGADMSSQSNNQYSLEKTLYILKIGEALLNFVYDSSVKVSIFKKLSGSLSQFRKFLIDNEARILS